MKIEVGACSSWSQVWRSEERRERGREAAGFVENEGYLVRAIVIGSFFFVTGSVTGQERSHASLGFSLARKGRCSRDPFLILALSCIHSTHLTRQLQNCF